VNIGVETSLAAWLRSQPAFDGIPCHTGQSAETIPQDQPVLFAACENVEIIGGALSRATASIVLATPSHLEVEQHHQLTTALRATLRDLPSLAPHFSSLAFAGAVLTGLTESQSESRWVCTATLVLGLGEI
jgi:hypothetical protein